MRVRNLRNVSNHQLTRADKRARSSVPLHPLIAQRWSPRALDPTAEVTEQQLRALLEAARWAASYGDTEPARYLIGRRGDPTFRRIHGILTGGNPSWTEAAAALLLGAVVTTNDKGDVPYAEYGLALASQNLVLQAVAEGLVAHQMAGFDHEAARQEFALPPNGGGTERSHPAPATHWPTWPSPANGANQPSKNRGTLWLSAPCFSKQGQSCSDFAGTPDVATAHFEPSPIRQTARAARVGLWITSVGCGQPAAYRADRCQDGGCADHP
jgi:hypothetical protein